jgi:plasmid stabilization system protein ParE
LKPFRVITTPDAEADILAAHDWIARESPDGAVLWVNGLESAIASLRRLPRRCPRAPESEAFLLEIRQLIYKSHRVLFTIEARSVVVLHVRHAARLPARPETD